MDKIAEVLAGLREERQRLLHELSRVERAIGALEDAMGIARSVPQDTAAAAPATVYVPLPYARMNVYEAAAAFLTASDGPRTTREIADALRAGGYPTRSRDFTSTVGTLLNRAEAARAYGIRRTENGKRWRVRT